jgi:hypothetical protein
MARLELSGDNEYIRKMKAHLEKEHPSTKGKLMLFTDPARHDQVINAVNNQRRIGFKDAFKKTIKDFGASGGKILKQISDPLDKIDADLKKSLGKYY